MKQNSTSLTRKRPVYNLVLAAMFLALGIILPFFTGQIPQIGNMLLPMHLPVFLCGLICGCPTGWRWAWSCRCCGIFCSLCRP